MAVISVGIVMLTGLLILVISSCLLKFEPKSRRAMILSARDYLTAGPVSLAFAVLIVTVEFAVALTGIRAQSRSEFRLPNVNFWAYTVRQTLPWSCKIPPCHASARTELKLPCGVWILPSLGTRPHISSVRWDP